ncbi:NUDIX domain-containing protein [Patescibacteria group bacterium]
MSSELPIYRNVIWHFSNIYKNMSSKPISASIQCFIKKGEKYLMLHRSEHKKILPGIWIAPGGRKKFKEGVFECARRELLEETGVKIKNIRLRAIGIGHSPAFDENREFCNYILVADYAGGKAKKKDDEGKLEWLTEAEIKNLQSLFSEDRKLLPYIFDDDKKVVSYIANFDKANPNKLIRFEVETEC